MQGYVSLVLHAHLPFVRHPEHDDFLEEDWLFEAITETYVPLLQAFFRLRDDGVPFAGTWTSCAPWPKARCAATLSPPPSGGWRATMTIACTASSCSSIAGAAIC